MTTDDRTTDRDTQENTPTLAPRLSHITRLKSNPNTHAGGGGWVKKTLVDSEAQFLSWDRGNMSPRLSPLESESEGQSDGDRDPPDRPTFNAVGQPHGYGA